MEASKTVIPQGPRFYDELAREIEAFADPVWFTALANAAASLKQHLPDVNWVGFYLMRDGELVLGPFQGLPACTRIAMGKGVCGTAARDQKSVVVKDVDQFPGHIACDSASRSEVVIPLVREGRVIGVLDVDSPSLARFDDADRAGLELVVSKLLRVNSFPEAF
jgi:GAF domain-containing protein